MLRATIGGAARYFDAERAPEGKGDDVIIPTLRGQDRLRH